MPESDARSVGVGGARGQLSSVGHVDSLSKLSSVGHVDSLSQLAGLGPWQPALLETSQQLGQNHL